MVRPVRPAQILVCGSVVGVLILAAGCNDRPQPRERPVEEVHIARFYSLYAGCRSSMKGKSPANAEQVREWAKKQPKDKLAQLGVEDVEAACISPRDNQPYVVVELVMGMGPIVAHEKDGVAGRRLVVNSQGSVIDANEEQFQSLLRSLPKAGPKMGPGPGTKYGSKAPGDGGPGPKQGAKGSAAKPGP